MTRSWLHQPERSTSTALSLIHWIAVKLGRRPARLLLYPITAYYLIFSPAPRRHSRAFFGRVLGRRAGTLHLARHFHSFAAVILDRVFLLTGRAHLLDVRVYHTDLLNSLLERKRGALLLGAHFGSFEVLRALAVTRAGYDVRVLMRRRQNARLTRALDKLNPQVANTVIDLDDPAALFRVHEAVNEGALVGILGDRSVTGDAMLPCPFFGEQALFPTGPMRLAAVLGAPVILFFGIYEGGNRYSIHFESLTEGAQVAPHARGQWVDEMTARYAARLEAHVRRAPENWFNFYDFWARDKAGRDHAGRPDPAESPPRAHTGRTK